MLASCQTSQPLNRPMGYYITINVGNTLVHYCLHNAEVLVHTWTSPHTSKTYPDPSTLLPTIPGHPTAFNSPTPVYIISVVPAETSSLQSLFPDSTTFSNTTFFPPSLNGYATLGIDRAAALHAAITLSPATPVLVIDAGTALTTTVSQGDGKFGGGQICPGLRTMFRALANNTAMLPDLDMILLGKEIIGHATSNTTYPRFATDTATSIKSGIFYSAAAGVRASILAFHLAKPGEPASVYFTGGDGEALLHLVRSVAPGDKLPKNVELEFRKDLIHVAMQEKVVSGVLT